MLLLEANLITELQETLLAQNIEDQKVHSILFNLMGIFKTNCSAHNMIILNWKMHSKIMNS